MYQEVQSGRRLVVIILKNSDKECPVMQFGIQKVRWHNETFTADVLDDKGNVVRTIQYTPREYVLCKALYIERGGRQ